MSVLEESHLSPEWRLASSPDRTIALTLFASLEENSPDCFLQGNPATGETTIDGTFNLVRVARRLIEILQQQP